MATALLTARLGQSSASGLQDGLSFEPVTVPEITFCRGTVTKYPLLRYRVLQLTTIVHGLQIKVTVNGKSPLVRSKEHRHALALTARLFC